MPLYLYIQNGYILNALMRYIRISPAARSSRTFKCSSARAVSVTSFSVPCKK